MCSFLFVLSKTEYRISELEKANISLQSRGPDSTNSYVTRYKGFNFYFYHNLLDISGNSIQQPVIDSDLSMIGMFNGEFFNYKKFLNSPSDTQALLQVLKNNLLTELDGEFAIVQFSKSDFKIHFYADAFLTKPMFWAINEKGDFAISSYSSSLQSLGFENVIMMEPNSHYIYDISSSNCYRQNQIFEFNIQQTKTTYNDWIESFVESVRLRALHGFELPFLPLSSGYDSGAIALALQLLNIKFDTFSITEGEDVRTLAKRFKLIKGNCYRIKNINKKEFNRFNELLQNSLEDVEYYHEDGPGIRNSIKTDQSSIGLAYIARMAQQKGYKVSLSGSGSDEIMSDYGFSGNKIYYHSEFGGNFPQNLADIFPWKKFYGDTMRSYLFKDEVVLGGFGIEGRYPFLGRDVVQEFLSLDVNLKNAHYKAPIKAFFDKYNYPYNEGIKIGFNRIPVTTSLFDMNFWKKKLLMKN